MTMETMNSFIAVNELVRLDPPKNKVAPEDSPLELIEWSFSKFDHQSTVITTAFGMEGCALIDMFSQFTDSLKIAYIDTGFFFPETQKLIETMQRKYDKFLDGYSRDQPWSRPFVCGRHGTS